MFTRQVISITRRSNMSHDTRKPDFLPELSNHMYIFTSSYITKQHTNSNWQVFGKSYQQSLAEAYQPSTKKTLLMRKKRVMKEAAKNKVELDGKKYICVSDRHGRI